MSLNVSSTPARRRGCAIVAAATTGATLLLAPSAASAAAAPTARPAFAGTAYGSVVNLGSVLQSGKTAALPLCTTTAPTAKNIHTAALSLPGVGSIGAVDTYVSGARSKVASASATRSTTAETSLLGGLVTLRAVSASAKARHTGKGYTLTPSATFVGLKIGGVALPAAPKPNTTVALPGIGSISLNVQARSNRLGTHAVAVRAVKIVVGANLMGFPKGTITIGYARAALHDAIHRNVTGAAYGTQVTVGGSVVKSGPTAPAYLPCGGSNGTLVSNATAATTVPSVLSVGAVRSSAVSYDGAGRTTAITANRIANVSLLGGKIKVAALTTRAVASRTTHGGSRAATGTLFAGLTINGKAYAGTVPANTKYSLPGLGTLYVNRQVTSANGLHVYGLQLVLGTATGGLPAGATVTVGSASAGVNAK